MENKTEEQKGIDWSIIMMFALVVGVVFIVGSLLFVRIRKKEKTKISGEGAENSEI